MSIRKKIIIFSLLLLPFLIFANDTWIEDSAKINPQLQDLVSIAENDSNYFRLLLYRGGYEHVSVKIVIQKFTVDYSNRNEPYKLKKSILIDELQTAYNLSVDSISESNKIFKIILNGVNTYTYENVSVELLLYQDLNYEVYISSSTN